MLTVGGAISGYSEIGSVRWTSAPAMVIRIDSTAAKIGRSMKKCENRIPLVRRHPAVGWMDLALLRGDHHARADERVGDAGDHHPVGRHEARGDDAQPQR